MAAFSVMSSATTRTASLSASDLRNAILSLDGQSTFITSLLFDTETGVNIAPAQIIAQINRDGSVNYTGGSYIEYPFSQQHNAHHNPLTATTPHPITQCLSSP